MLTPAGTLIPWAALLSPSVPLRPCWVLWEPFCLQGVTGLCLNDFCKGKGINLRNAQVRMVEKSLSSFYVSSREGPPWQCINWAPVLTYRISDLVLCWRCTRNKPDSGLMSSYLEKVLHVWGSVKDSRDGTWRRGRKNWGQEWWSARVTEEEMGKSWSYWLGNIIAYTEDVNKTPNFLHCAKES